MNQATVRHRFEWHFWAHPGPGKYHCLECFAARLREEGNLTLEIDEEHQRVLIGMVTNG